MVEREAEHPVARLEDREVDGHVRLRSRVRLHVGVLGAEERRRAVPRQLLDLVDDLAAAVVALAGIALGVLFVGTEPTASSTLGQVKFSDAISSIWPRCRSSSRPRSLRDLGVDLGQPGGTELLEGLLGHGHLPRCYWASATARLRTRSSASAAGAAPSRSTLRLGACEVEHGRGDPGQVARVELRAAAPCGSAPERRRAQTGSRPPGVVGARCGDAADGLDDTRPPRPEELGTRTPIASGRDTRQPGVAAGRDSRARA